MPLPRCSKSLRRTSEHEYPRSVVGRKSARGRTSLGQLEVERLWDKVYDGTIYHGRRGLGIMLMSAIDNALHDLRGKLLGLPAYQLLGGKARDRITPYLTLFPSMPQGRSWEEM